MSYFTKVRKENLTKTIDHVSRHPYITIDELKSDIMAAFIVTEGKAQSYIDFLVERGILKFVMKNGKITKMLIKDSKKLEAIK
jgi:hypothetical protein